MRSVSSALAAFSFSLLLSAASRIDDPKTFVTEVYRRLMATPSYTPPDGIYSPRLEKLLRDDKKKAKGEVGCLDFVFWVNAQDWTITRLTITTTDVAPKVAAGQEGRDRKIVITKFLNNGEPQEIHFNFIRSSGRWLLDDAHSVSSPPWTLSAVLKCTP